MSRFFDSSGTDEFLEKDSAIVTAPPFSISAWIRPNSFTSSAAFVQLANKSTSDDRFRMYISSSSQKYTFAVDDNGSQAFAEVNVVLSTGVWVHAAAVEVADNDHRAYLNGTLKTATLQKNPAGVDRTSIGRAGDSSPTNFFDGDIAHVAIWNVALSSDEIDSLVVGVSPLKIRRDSLVAYYPVGGQSPELDVVGGNDLTVNGTPLQSDEPPIPNSVVAPG